MLPPFENGVCIKFTISLSVGTLITHLRINGHNLWPTICDLWLANINNQIQWKKYPRWDLNSGPSKHKDCETNALTVTLSFAFLFLYIYMLYIVQVKNHKNVMRAHHNFGYFRKCNINLGPWEKAQALIHFCALPFALKSFVGFAIYRFGKQANIKQAQSYLIIKSPNSSLVYWRIN